MKKLWSLVLIVCMLFGYTGCASLVTLPKAEGEHTEISSTKDKTSSNKKKSLVNN